MYILVVFVITIAVSLGVLSDRASLRAADVVITPSLQVDQYRLFMYAANTYMSGTLTAVTSPTSVFWPELKTFAGLPPSAIDMVLPADWKVVRSPDGSWVACTAMEESSVTALSTRTAMPGVVAVAGMEASAIPVSAAMTPSADLLVTPVTATSAATASVSALGGAAVTHQVMSDAATAPALALLCL